LFTFWSYSKAKLQVFFVILTGNSPFRFCFLLLLSAYLHILFLQFVINLKYWYLVHAHFEGCPFLKTDVCPYQQTAKFSVALLTTISIFRNIYRLILLLRVPYHRFMIKLSDNRFGKFPSGHLS